VEGRPLFVEARALLLEPDRGGEEEKKKVEGGYQNCKVLGPFAGVLRSTGGGGGGRGFIDVDAGNNGDKASLLFCQKPPQDSSPHRSSKVRGADTTAIFGRKERIENRLIVLIQTLGKWRKSND